ncbi:MAG TPA: hypothetical protein PKD94_04595 [Ignavibacteria bacterium]|nr:hypothetical protein [Ignavibacteria bacterium]
MPGWINSVIEEIRYALVKDGFDNEKLLEMKYSELCKLNFLRYKNNYIDWYRYSKSKPKT